MLQDITSESDPYSCLSSTLTESGHCVTRASPREVFISVPPGDSSTSADTALAADSDDSAFPLSHPDSTLRRSERDLPT